MTFEDVREYEKDLQAKTNVKVLGGGGSSVKS